MFVDASPDWININIRARGRRQRRRINNRRLGANSRCYLVPAGFAVKVHRFFFFSLSFFGGAVGGGLSATLAHCATKTTRLCPKLNIPTPGPAQAEGSTHRRKSRAAGRADTLRFLEPFSGHLDSAKLLYGAASGFDEGERNPPTRTHATRPHADPSGQPPLHRQCPSPLTRTITRGPRLNNLKSIIIDLYPKFL